MVTKKEAFEDVMQIQSQYEFLGHNKRTSKEVKQELIKRINARIEKLKAKALVIILALGLGISVMSCNKQDQPIEQKELVTQEFSLKNLYSQPMTKGFDPSTWVYTYNPDKFNLTFTSTSNPAETVTKSVSISELIAGTSLTLYKGLYNVSFISAHSVTDWTKLDASINMTNVNVQGTPIPLTGNYEDALIVIDFADMKRVTVSDWGGFPTPVFTLKDGFYYLYLNQSMGNMVTVEFNNPETANKVFTLESKVKGNVYWYTSPLGASTNLTFPNWTVNKISL